MLLSVDCSEEGNGLVSNYIEAKVEEKEVVGR